jgi:hypothetical protein
MGEVENVAWQMRMVCVAPVCLSTKNVSSVTCSILADSGAGFRARTATPISKPEPAKLQGPVSKSPGLPKLNFFFF